ncbi:MAG: SRPBCC family protein [Bacteroidota bacterium]
MSTTNNTSDRELVMTRLIDAPRELVFTVWTDPKHIVHWWGPTGFTNTIHKMDVRPGGKFLLTMHGPDGTDYPNEIVYGEIVKPEKITWSHGSGVEDDPGQFKVTVLFEAQGQKTLLTMRMLFLTKDAKDMVVEKYGAIEGNRQTMDRLEEYCRTHYTEIMPLIGAAGSQ